MSTRLKGKVYKMTVRPSMLYGLETMKLIKRHEAELMLRISLGGIKADWIRNEYISETAQVE